MAFENKQPYFRRIFAGKNVYIFAVVAIAFAALNIYRLSPKVVIFYKKHTFFSNYVINTTYRRALSAFKILQDKGLAQVIVIAQGYDTVEELNNLLGEEDYLNYKNIIFAADTKTAGKDYGIRSWPHLYVISSDNRVIYETKIGSADKVQQILWRD